MAERQPTPVEKYQKALGDHAEVVVHGDRAARAASSAHVGEVATQTYIELAAQERRIQGGQ